MQDLNDLLYFAEVVDRGGFAAAGRALGVPKSRLSRRVAELEARLGARLLQRTTRKLSLTAVGEQFHRHCVAMREDAQAAEDAVAQAQTEPRGIIRVACPVTLAQTTLGPLLPQFLARYPQVKVDLRISNRPVDLVEEGFDVALRVRSTLDDSGSLVVKNLGTTQTLLVASPAQLARQGVPKTTADLARLDTVSMSAADGRTVWDLLGPDGTTYSFQHRPRYVADDLLTLKLAVLRGTGVCLLPDYMCSDEIRDQSLVRVLPDWAPRPSIFHAVFPSRRGLIPAVRRFLDFLGEAVLREGVAHPAMTAMP
ncbi:MAG: LysR family transcriptional regulator [Betaproteobacteria bacterium]|nr:LysR family transcriptional regulator [Betaproteobacteria bacterium]